VAFSSKFRSSLGCSQSVVATGEPPAVAVFSSPLVGRSRLRTQENRNTAGACKVNATVNGATTSPPELARELFAPIAPTYERWARLLSMGQDARWRRAMVDGLGLSPGSRVLDVAAGTGSITRLMELRGLEVLSVDQSWEMTQMAVRRNATAVLATAERLPFADGTFNGVTFGYLLRYVDDVSRCLEELVRIVRPGSAVGMVEFGRPAGAWLPVWWLYTRTVLPVAGFVIRSGWWQVGRFLSPSINTFARSYPPDGLAAEWRAAGMEDVRYRRMSLGGGLVMWGRRR
jgi:demethylmenaquinone methyltransferase/2-methoxy-6-polyprenyl-1,4-benzoquinol methylase